MLVADKALKLVKQQETDSVEYDIFWLKDGDETIFECAQSDGSMLSCAFVFWRKSAAPGCALREANTIELPDAGKNRIWECGCKCVCVDFTDIGSLEIEGVNFEKVEKMTERRMRQAIDNLRKDDEIPSPSQVLIDLLEAPQIDEARSILVLIRNKSGGMHIRCSNMSYRDGFKIMAEAIEHFAEERL